MPRLNPEQVAKLALDAGLTPEAAKIAVAVAKGESGYRTDAVGDVSLQDATWGPSIGLWQIRSVKAEEGKGTARDASRLTDPAFNARSMAQISNRGRNWQPWTVYRTGAYKVHLAEAGEAVRKALSGDVPPVPSSEPSEIEARAASGIGALLDPRTWRNVAYVVGGGVAVIVGLLLVGREMTGSELVSKVVEAVR